MTDRYARLRAALDSAVTGASDPTANWLCVGGHTVMLNSGRPVWARIAACEHRPNAAYIATCDPGTIGALLAERDRLLDAVQETIRVIESDPPSITDTVWVTGNMPETLLDRCRAALAQEQGGSDGND